MKRKLPPLFITLIICSAMYSQKLDESKVSSPAKDAFKQKYPGTTGKWEKENGNYEVNFKKDGKTMSAVIDIKGTILETETDIAIKDLPTSVTSYLSEHYQGAAIKEAALIVKSSGESMYEAEVNKKDLLFDAATCKFIKEAKD